jgi:NTP pyrophosphatase (non-canonical NTP hydrolase)
MTEGKMIDDSDLNHHDKIFIEQFNSGVGMVHDIAVEHGFHESEDIQDLRVLGNKMMLMVGELSEAHESIRKQGLDARCEKPVDINALEEEFADVIIRIMDTAEALNRSGLPMNLGRAIVLKAKYNDSRPYKHGKKF